MVNRNLFTVNKIGLADNDVHSLFIPLGDTNGGSIQIILTNGVSTDDVVVHAYLSNGEGGNADLDYTPVDDLILGTQAATTGVSNSSGVVNEIHLLDTQLVAEMLKITYQRTSGNANDANVKIFVKRG